MVDGFTATEVVPTCIRMMRFAQFFPFKYHERVLLYIKGVVNLILMSPKKEQDRLDIYHKMFLVTRQDELHRAPITRNYSPPRILDLGTGTGIWAIDMAE